jgi:hypothetical protein
LAGKPFEFGKAAYTFTSKQLREDEKNYYCEFGHKQIYGTVALSKRDQKVRPLMTHPKLSDFSFIYEKIHSLALALCGIRD